MNTLNSFAKVGLFSIVLAASVSSFAQTSKVSISEAMKNAAASSNTTETVESMAKNGKGRESDSNGDYHSNCHTGSKGRGAGGNDKGEGCGTPPPQCVPEPASMLAMGIGAGIVALRKRRAAKA